MGNGFRAFFRKATGVALVACSFVVGVARADLLYTGVSLAGAEFAADLGGYDSLPGTYNSDYTYPSAQEIEYFQSKGMNTIPIPFRWERLQPTPNQPLDLAELTAHAVPEPGPAAYLALGAMIIGRRVRRPAA